MFIYLSKKIAIPNGVKLHTLSWNTEAGWIACGGENGLLKVLKLESQAGADSKAKGVAAPSNLSMNQTLEGHNNAVICSTWNSSYRKLTTSDENGLIIVWMLHKGMWFEEMINNRNKSVVKDMSWTADGQKICIVYKDGAVIVGSVDGNRLWGKELPHDLMFVQWSPDGRHILFITPESKVHIYDNTGNRLSTLPLYALEQGGRDANIVGVHWYDGTQGYVSTDAPVLAIGFDDGRVQITRGEHDDRPVLIDCGMDLSSINWNCNGTVLACSGTKQQQLKNGDSRELSMVQFYAPSGQHLRTLKVPGKGINALSWENGGLRIALAVESFIYFANIRPDYKWGYFGNTLAYAYNKAERKEQCVVFWDTNSEEKYTKYVKNLIRIRSGGDNCVLVTKSDDGSGKFILILCNAIGSPVDSKYIDLEPVYTAMTKYHVIVASEESVYVWQYRTPVSKLTSLDTGTGLRRKEGRERIFHVDDTGYGGDDRIGQKVSEYDALRARPTSDEVCSVAANGKYLIVGRSSGTIHRYTLPHLSLENKFMVRCRPHLLGINCDSTRLSIIDINGILTFFDCDEDGGTVAATSPGRMASPGVSRMTGKQLDFERKDSWDMVWSEDNPKLFAMMEKTRMYIFRGLEPEEPVLSSGYLCQFKDLTIRSVMLDEVMASPDKPAKDMMIDYETKGLRHLRDLLNVSLEDATQYIEDNPHPRLWKLLSAASLKALSFTLAEKSFVNCADYQGIQFVKRLRGLKDKDKQRAEVMAYFQNFEEAVKLYQELDRLDLAVDLRQRLGDWFKVVQLLSKTDGPDARLKEAYGKIGEYYATRQSWAKAAANYKKADDLEMLAECLYRIEDFAGLKKVSRQLPEASQMLSSIGEKFQSVGMCDEAVEAFLKHGDVKAAVDCCVMLNQWNQAVELAQAHDFPQIEGLLGKYASSMLEQGNRLEAIALYRKANKSPEAAKLLCALADEAVKGPGDMIRAKKLYVLAALELENFKRRTLNTTTMAGATAAETTAATLDNLMTHDAAVGQSKNLDAPWKGAEALHFYLLAHRQLYDGNVDAAMRTSIRLADYEGILDVKDIYSLIALTTFYNKHYRECSKAFTKLETMKGITQDVRDQYSDMALSIFSVCQPKNPKARTAPCPSCQTEVWDFQTSCGSCGIGFPACVASGRPIVQFNQRLYKCKNCGHQSFEQALRGFTTCPLCHCSLVG
jgi:WD repeat-containing protein 35